MRHDKASGLDNENTMYINYSRVVIVTWIHFSYRIPSYIFLGQIIISINITILSSIKAEELSPLKISHHEAEKVYYT